MASRNSRFSSGAARILLAAPSFTSAGFRTIARLSFVTLTAGALAACAQSSVVTKSELGVASRPTSLSSNQDKVVANRPGVSVTERRPLATTKHTAAAKTTSYGLASFYQYDSRTANGEKFDPNKLTAAHRTLPFGTRLQVTDVVTGRSVMVRVNDRGPFVPGRVVDLSYAAAEKLGIVGRGVARVKVAVVQ